MILIEKIRVSPDNNYLEVVVSTDVTKKFTGLKVKYETTNDITDWTSVDVDLSTSLSGNSNYEALYLPFGTSPNLEANHLYIIQLTAANSIDPGVDVEYNTVAVAPLTMFYYCLVDRVLKLRSKCDTCLYDVEVLYFLLEGLQNAIKLGMYEQAIEFWKELEVICDYNCQTCDEETISTANQGIGVWVLNNNFIVQ
jgi:hypothetical protein